MANWPLSRPPPRISCGVFSPNVSWAHFWIQIVPFSRTSFYYFPVGFGRSWCPRPRTLSLQEPPGKEQRENHNKAYKKSSSVAGEEVPITKRPMKNFLMPDMPAGAGSSWCGLGASATFAWIVLYDMRLGTLVICTEKNTSDATCVAESEQLHLGMD